MRRAKIVCTLGPSTNTDSAIDGLVKAGMDCARLNFSHGSHEGHAQAAAMVRAAAARAGRPIAILADLCGPKIRVGKFGAGPVELVVGASFDLHMNDRPGDVTGIGVSYTALADDVEPGDALLLDDGLLRLKVERISPAHEGHAAIVHTVVEVGGTLSDKKGINVPGRALSTKAVTDKDKRDLAFAVDEIGVDYIALSFVRSAEDILEAKHLAKGTPIIAKIEKPDAIKNLSAILDAADGAMVARGDLGVEVGAEKVPLLQKRIIKAVNDRRKVVITATQMLDSMIRNPTPTRAEAADVANAIIDGTDAVMLSGETASGKHPHLAVEMMDKIIREVEADWLSTVSKSREVEAFGEEWAFPDAAARAAALMSFALPIEAIVVFTRDGRTASLISEYRPRSPIVALTPDRRVANQLALDWGVIPRVDVPPEHLAEAVRVATGIVLREGICKVNDELALVLGWPVSSGTNTIKLHRI
jgi:pyruvate kinase